MNIRHIRIVFAACLLATFANAAAAQSAQQPVLTRPPELVEFVEADWPDPEVTNDVAVEIELVIDATGAVVEASVVEPGLPAFDAAAVAAVLRFQFTPAEIDNVPAPIRIRYVYEFYAPLPELPPPPAIFAGTIADADSGAPVEGVRVSAAGMERVTDSTGSFVFEGMPLGEFEIVIEGERIPTLFGSETIGEGEHIVATYSVALLEETSGPREFLLEIVITAPQATTTSTSVRMTAEDARSVAGSGGDVVRVVENMPGVARSGAAQSGLVVWGAAPEDTRVYLDGVPLPRLYHESGIRAVIHPDFVRSVELVPGGWGANYGRGLGGIVVVDTTTNPDPGLHGSIAADIYDVSAAVSGTTEDGWSAGIAGRYGIARQLAQAIRPEAGAFAPIPEFWDGQARVMRQINDETRVGVFVISSSDQIERGVANVDPALVTSEARTTRFTRVALQFAHETADGTATAITPWIGFDNTTRASAFGAVETSEASRGSSIGLRASHTASPLPGLELQLGADIEAAFQNNERIGSPSLPPREGDARVFGQPPPDVITNDRWRGATLGAAPFVEARINLFEERLRIVPGLRLDPYIRSVSKRIPETAIIPPIGLTRSDLHVEPRLAIDYSPIEALSLRVAGGIYRQYANAADTSAVFGNPDLPTARAAHLLAGIGLKFTEWLELDVTGFRSQSDRLAVRSESPTPPIAQSLEAEGEGRARGIQVLVRVDPEGGFSGWAAYTLSSAERRSTSDADWRFFDYDQTHVFTALAGYATESGWDFSARFRYATGLPRTEVVGAVFDAARDRFEPVFGKPNAIRLPSFYQLDLRVGKRFELRHGELSVFVEATNATARENVEEFVYSADYERREGITGLPLLPSLGVQWKF